MKTKLKYATKLLLTGSLAFVVGAYMVLKAPQYHADYLRYKVGPNVVTITTKSKRNGGTGFFVQAPSGKVVLLTNNHVCGLADRTGKVLVTTQDNEEYNAKVLHKFKKHDLCIVENKTTKSGLTVASSVDIGEEIGHVGHPQLYPLTLTRGQLIGYATIPIATGMVNHPRECPQGSKAVNALFFIVCITEYDSGLTTVPSQGGSSGSPIISFWGNVVGVLFAGDSSSWSVIVPLKYVKEFLADK